MNKAPLKKTLSLILASALFVLTQACAPNRPALGRIADVQNETSGNIHIEEEKQAAEDEDPVHGIGRLFPRLDRGSTPKLIAAESLPRPLPDPPSLPQPSPQPAEESETDLRESAPPTETAPLMKREEPSPSPTESRPAPTLTPQTASRPPVTSFASSTAAAVSEAVTAGSSVLSDLPSALLTTEREVQTDTKQTEAAASVTTETAAEPTVPVTAAPPPETAPETAAESVETSAETTTVTEPVSTTTEETAPVTTAASSTPVATEPPTPIPTETTTARLTTTITTTTAAPTTAATTASPATTTAAPAPTTVPATTTTTTTTTTQATTTTTTTTTTVPPTTTTTATTTTTPAATTTTTAPPTTVPPATAAPTPVPAGISLPVQRYSYISSLYGIRVHPINGNVSFHYGTDFAAGAGTPVLSILSGTVTVAENPYEGQTYTDHKSGFGNYIQVRHDNGSFATYAHLRNVSVSAGQRVESGQVIGTVGSTGASTGPHLHLEITDYVHGDPGRGYRINPLSARYLGPLIG